MLRFDIEENIIIEAFPSLRFDTCLHYRGTYVLHLNLSALQRLVLLLEVSTPQGSELHLNVSALQRPVLLLEVSTPQGPKLIWTCLHYRGMCCSWRCLPTPQGPELLLNVYALQSLVLLLEVSNPQGPVPIYCRKCSLRFENNFLAIYCIRFSSKIILSLSIVFAWLWKIICVL